MSTLSIPRTSTPDERTHNGPFKQHTRGKPAQSERSQRIPRARSCYPIASPLPATHAHRRWPKRAAPAVLFALSCTLACGDTAPSELSVRLVTDYVPGVAFFSVETVIDGPGASAPQTSAVSSGDNFEAPMGLLVAQFADLARGSYTVEVRLLGQNSETLASRTVAAEVDGFTPAVVVIGRDCDDCMLGDGGIVPFDGAVLDAGRPSDARPDAMLNHDADSRDASPSDSAAGNCGESCTVACGTGVIDCSGPTPECADLEPVPMGTICRASSGNCDVEEECNGWSVECPPDALHPTGYVCRPAAGDCDIAEHCTGMSGQCPSDTLHSSDQICRLATRQCDVTDRCDGLTPMCPNVFASTGDACTNGMCDGSGGCTITCGQLGQPCCEGDPRWCDGDSLCALDDDIGLVCMPI